MSTLEYHKIENKHQELCQSMNHYNGNPLSPCVRLSAAGPRETSLIRLSGLVREANHVSEWARERESEEEEEEEKMFPASPLIL